MQNMRAVATRRCTEVSTVLILLVPALAAAAADVPGTFAPAPVVSDMTMRGTLFISGGGKIPEAALQQFIDLAGGESARLAVITTASVTADSPDIEPRIAAFRRFRLAELSILHTRSRDVADSVEFIKPLTRATGVWFIGGHQDRLTAAYSGTAVESAIHQVLERGGVVGGTSAGAAIMSPLMIVGGNANAEVAPGFGFLPGTVIDQHFLKRHRENRLLGVLADHPHLVGLGIDEGASVVVQGRKLTVVSESFSESDFPVRACYAPVGNRPAHKKSLRPGEVVDLVALRRTAVSRMRPHTRWSDAPKDKLVPKGTLVLVGGGKTPAQATERFIRAAGGAEAKFVVVTTAAGDTPPTDAEATGWLTDAGVKTVRRIHARTAKEADDPAVLDVLRTAGGVWFTGGRQWRLVDAFFDTAAEQLLHSVLLRGGAIGGSAAGASIQASYLVRGNPLTNKPIMADGYDEGFGFLQGAAVDPFFSSRKRFGDMAELKTARPELLGFGLDEETAVVVQGNDVEVLGEHNVCVYDRCDASENRLSRFDRLYAGDHYDVHERKRIGHEGSDAEQVELAARAEQADAAAEKGQLADSDSEGETQSAHPPLLCE